MPFSEDLNLLFIHIPKNAGKSIEVFFGIVSEGEATRYTFRSFVNRAATLVQRKSADPKVKERLWGISDYTLCNQHLTLAEIELLNLVSPEKIDRAIRFAVVRNPWSRAVSTYRHFAGRDAAPSKFSSFLQEWFKSPFRDHNELAHRRPQTDFVRRKDGSIGVEVLRFEELAKDLHDFCGRHQLTINTSLGHVGTEKHGRVNYRDYYDATARRIVEDLFADDIEQFGYEF